MESIDTNEINVKRVFVATYNADAFNVEDFNAYHEISEILSKARWVDVFTVEDEDFMDLAKSLDYTPDNLPDKIYAIENQLTFTML